MRKTRINPRLIAATLTMMTMVSTVSPTALYAAETEADQAIESNYEYDLADENESNEEAAPAIQEETVNSSESEETDKEEAPQATEENAEESSSKETEDEEIKSEEKSEEETDIEDDEKSDDESDKKEKSEEEDKNEILSSATEQVEPIINDVADGKYTTTSQIIDDLTKKTIQYVNDNFIKSLPYVGEIVNSLIANSLGEEPKEDSLVKRLDNISDKLDMLNKTIVTSTEEITKQQERIMQNNKIQAMNSAYSNLVNSYSANNEDFVNAMKIIGQNDNSRHRAANLKIATDLLSGIYTTKNRNFYNQYIDYCKLIMSGTEQVEEYGEFNPNIFAAFHAVSLCHKKGQHAKIEFARQNKKLIKQVSDTCSYGYDVLHTIMETQLANQEALNKTYAQAIKDLDEQLKTASKEQKILIEDTRNDLKLMLGSGYTRFETLTNDKKELEGMKQLINAFIDHEASDLDNVEKAYNEYTPNNQINYFYKTYGTEKTADKKTLFPKLSENGKSIEYRDCYGNLRGRRTIEDGYKEVNQYKVEEGKTYHLKMTSNIGKALLWVFGETTEQDVKITRVYEGNGVLFGTCRKVEGIDIKTNKRCSFSIGDGEYTVYEKVVGDFKEVTEA